MTTNSIVKMVLLLVVLALLVGCPTNYENNLKKTLGRNGGLEELKQFTTSKIGQDRKSIDKEELLNPAVFTKSVKSVRPHDAFMLYGSDGRVGAIVFEFGGGFHHFGVIVGSLKGLEHEGIYTKWVKNQWDDNTWYYEDCFDRRHASN